MQSPSLARPQELHPRSRRFAGCTPARRSSSAGTSSTPLRVFSPRLFFVRCPSSFAFTHLIDVSQLRAFERFLHDYPQWQHKVVLIQVTSPSPGDSPALATKVSELVDQINGTYGSLEFQPVHHYHQTVERDVRTRSWPFPIFMLTPVLFSAGILCPVDCCRSRTHHFDPRRYEHDEVRSFPCERARRPNRKLNCLLSFSMEYIICQAEAKGPLMVSEFTGVAATLSKALKVNPWDLGVSSIGRE